MRVVSGQSEDAAPDVHHPGPSSRSHLDQPCCSAALLLLVVSQGGQGHVLHQPLELLVPGHEIRLTVDLHAAEKTTGVAPDRPPGGDTESPSQTQLAHLHDDGVLIFLQHADETLVGLATLQLAGFAPTLLLGLLMEPRFCLAVGPQ